MELTAKNLVKSYQNKIVVDKVDLKVSSGETVGLLGPNGAGKTTFFYMMVGLIKCDSGEVFFNEERTTNHNISSRAEKGIAYLPQEASVFRRLSVEDNIKASLEQRKDLRSNQNQEELKRLIKDFKLQKFKDFKTIQLSGGERRRVEIARALALNPSFLLLDEPFAGIDPISITELKETIKKLNTNNLGILISDHNVRDTMQICDKVLVINEGKIIAEGTAKEVSNNKIVKEVYLGENFDV